MRVTIVLAVLALSLTLFLSNCSTAYAQEEDLVAVAPEPEAVEIGESLVHPASPLYFLKTLREQIELAFSVSSEAKLNRELEFAQRRLREVKSLIKVKQQEMIQPTLDKYLRHITQVGQFSQSGNDSSVRAGEAISRHVDVLARVYDQVGNPSAKAAILESLKRAEQHNRELLTKLDITRQQQLIRKIAAHQALACRFLTREATTSSLADDQKQALKERVIGCRENVREKLKDEILDLRKKRQNIKEEVINQQRDRRSSTPSSTAQ